MRRLRPVPFLWLLPLLLAQLACSRLFSPRPAIAWDPSPEALIVRASDCCGLVPTSFAENYIPEAQLFGDGRLVWVQYDDNHARRVLTAQLTPAEMQDVLQGIVDAGFFGWKDTYADYSVTDLPNTCLRVTLQSATKSVCEYYRGAPAAFHRLFGELATGAGHAGTDLVPERGYLNAYPLADGYTPATQWQWPAEALGVSLAEVAAAGGMWVEGPALELAWTIVNDNYWNTTVQEGVQYYELTVQAAGASWNQLPAP